jgi:hypothetical protein
VRKQGLHIGPEFPYAKGLVINFRRARATDDVEGFVSEAGARFKGLARIEIFIVSIRALNWLYAVGTRNYLPSRVVKIIPRKTAFLCESLYHFIRRAIFEDLVIYILIN